MAKETTDDGFCWLSEYDLRGLSPTNLRDPHLDPTGPPVTHPFLAGDIDINWKVEFPIVPFQAGGLASSAS